MNCRHYHFTAILLNRLSSLPAYYIPKDGALSSYKEYISMLPNMDHPEAFGQHPNADITSQIQETRLLFETLLSMQPQTATGTGESREEKVGLNFGNGNGFLF
jgi:dynein heavy chain